MQLLQISKFGFKLLIFIIVNVSLRRQDSRIADKGGGGRSGVASAWMVAAAALVSSETAAATTATPLPRIRPPRVQLNKCCLYGEHLDANQTCVMGSSELWVPLIFLINRTSYFSPAGGKPKFITFAENVRPAMQVESPEQGAVNSSSDAERQSSQQGCMLDELEFFTGSANLVIFSNGSLYVRERGQLIEPQRYCVDHDAALVCFPRDKSAPPRIRIRKCCGLSGSYDASKKTCTFPTANSDASDSVSTAFQLPLNTSVHETIYGFPQCQEKMTAYAIAGDFEVTRLHAATGVLQLPHKNLSTADYCLEHLRDGDRAATVKVFTCLHHFVGDAPANAVAAADSVASNRLQVAVLNIGIVISVVFLAATLVAGYMMPSVHHVLHWRCQIYYVFCLFVGDLLLAYSQLSSALELGSAACLCVASAMHFFFLSAFFWLNTMCFNIWWTFRDFRPSSLERNQELLRLRLYSVYAWGVPLVISAIAVIVDHLPETQMLRPGFGVRSCWFSGEHLSIFAYFFGPVGLLLCANIMLFISTTHQLTCGLWKRDDVKSTTEKTALGKVCLKLVVVMGVTWIAEIISWLIGGPHSAWFFTDLINALQGVFIFIVVGCQPQVWAACKRFCCPRSRQEITNTTNGVQHSSSSQGLPSMAACGGEITQNTSVTTTIGNTTQAKIPMETVC